MPSGEVGRAITVSDRGRVWVATSSAIRTFDPASGRFQPPEILLEPAAQAAALLVTEASGPIEIWMLADEGRFLRYRSTTGAFEFVHAIRPERLRAPFLDLPARFVSTENGGFVVAGRTISTVVEYRSGQPGTFSEGPLGNGFGGIFAWPDGSVIVSETATGELWERRTDAWTSLGTRPADVTCTAPLGPDRALFATRLGPLVVIDRRGTACPLSAPLVSGRARALAALPTGVAYSGRTRDDRPVVGWIGVEEPQ